MQEITATILQSYTALQSDKSQNIFTYHAYILVQFCKKKTYRYATIQVYKQPNKPYQSQNFLDGNVEILCVRQYPVQHGQVQSWT